MPLISTKGAASAQGFGLTLGGEEPNYIEDVFSTWLYTGNGSTQTINNGIDLAGKGGLVWAKARLGASFSHAISDTIRGAGTSNAANKLLSTNLTTAENLATNCEYVSAFNSDGFSVTTGSPSAGGRVLNNSGSPYASWTFRKQPKFFDVVTYTGNGAVQTINHNLGSVPGCIIVKRTDSSANWGVYHRSVASGRLYLNLTDAIDNAGIVYVSSTSTSFTFEAGGSLVNNASGGTYVAYLFAHNAGGFGLSGTDNVISCGSYTGNSSATGPVITLGYEPQWLMIKRASSTSSWSIIDSMRGMPVGSADALLLANLSSAETSVDYVSPTATGFQVVSTSSEVNANGSTYIYIAIRRGPMRTPTTGTSVFAPIERAGTGASASISGISFPPDLAWSKARTAGPPVLFDKLRGPTLMLQSSSTSAESTQTNEVTSFNQNGISFGSSTFGYTNLDGEPYVNWLFRRAPGFFDEVCYTGTGANRTVAHNLAVAPELMIVKSRSNPYVSWFVYSSSTTAAKYLILDSTNSANTFSAAWNNTAPTSSVFTVGNAGATNGSGETFVAYLFATCPGVSKVGSYTGTGATQVINCGFTTGARFVLIKATSTTGDWYVWDSARGIVSGNDPYLLLNSTAAEVTNTDYIDTASTGFEISSTAPADINASGGTYIFLAIA